MGIFWLLPGFVYYVNIPRNMENITEEQFKAYESVRQSGATNMFDVRVVSDLSGLCRDTILFIMKNYEALKKKFER